jgi:hypothetical protein
MDITLAHDPACTIGRALLVTQHACWTFIAHDVACTVDILCSCDAVPMLQTVLGQGGLVQRCHRAQHLPKGLAGTLHCV